MKYYDYTRAPNPRRARIFMAEKGIEVETVQVDLGVQAQFEDWFRAINPRCTVPALQLEDGTVLCDNASIARYLEEIYPEPPLMGSTPTEKALVAEWWVRVETEGMMGVAEALRNTSEFFKNNAITGAERYAQIPELAERGRARAAAFLKVMDERLKDNAYLAGENFSAADIAGLTLIDFCRWIKLPVPEEYEALHRWYEAVSNRPSAKA